MKINNLNKDTLNISKTKFVVGIIIGLLFAFWLYSFAYCLREALRILSVSYDYEMWVLSEEETSFYNLIYAFISVIFGQSLCFIFWLDRTRNTHRKFSRKIRVIVNDQRSLNWYFLHWFTKLAFIFGLMFGAPSFGGYYAMSFYPKYNFLFILIVIVLFLQSWTTIRLVFKRNSFKWMIISAIAISLISFGFSKINIIDYKTLNENYLIKNVRHKYTLNLPESNIYKKQQQPSLVEKLYIVFAKNDTINPKPKIIVPENVEIDFEDLSMYIQDWKSMRYEREIHHINYIINIHKDVKMKFINKLKEQFARSGVHRISYAVIPKTREFDEKYYDLYYFPINIHSSFFDINEIYQSLDTFDIKFNVESDGKNSLVNGKTMDLNNMKTAFKDSLSKNSNCIVKLYIKDEDDFNTYFRLISNIWEGAYELRDEYSLTNYNKPFSELDSDERRILKRKYPIRVFDMTKERVDKFEPPH